MFCLLVDVGIRRETKNAKGLEDALRGILDAGGDIRYGWDLVDALRAGDRATDTHMLENLYDEMKDKPVVVDLKALWTDLGVGFVGDEVRFDDSARWAVIRRAITGEPRRTSKDFLQGAPRVILAGRTAGRPWTVR